MTTALQPYDSRYRAVRLINRLILDADITLKAFDDNVTRYDYERRQWFTVPPEVDVHKSKAPDLALRKLRWLLDTPHSVRYHIYYLLHHAFTLHVPDLEFPAIAESLAYVLRHVIDARTAIDIIWHLQDQRVWQYFTQHRHAHAPNGFHADIEQMITHLNQVDWQPLTTGWAKWNIEPTPWDSQSPVKPEATHV